MAAQASIRRYAPLYMVIFGVVAALVKRVGTRYIMERILALRPADVAVGLVASAFSYGAFRLRYGRKDNESWYKR